MTRWIRFLLDSGKVGDRRLLADTTFRELFRPQVVAPASMYTATALSRPRFFTYGLGWFLHDYAGESVAMHTGSIDGMSAIVGLLPERNVGLVVLSNTDHAEVRHALMYHVFDLHRGDRGSAAPARDWSRDLLALQTQARQRTEAARAAQERARTTGTRPSVALERYAGTYTDSTFGDVVIAVRDGRLHLTQGRARVGTLEHWHYDTFRARWEAVRAQPSLVTFAPDGTGGVASVRVGGVTYARSARGR